MFTILTFIITSCYLFQAWGMDYSNLIGISLILIACISATIADYYVIKEYLQKGDKNHKSRLLK